MNEDEDELISAGLDDELEEADRKTLAEPSRDHAVDDARSRAFRRVDEELRSHGLESIGQERLDASLTRLRDRLGFEPLESTPNSAGRGEISGADVPPRWRGRSLWLGVAAAAAFVLYLVQPASEPSPDPAPLSSTVELGEELMLALGYDEDLSASDGISIEDLDVIEQLDLLDFLSARDEKERG